MTCSWCSEIKKLTHICTTCDAQFCCAAEAEMYAKLFGLTIQETIKEIEDAKHK
jgi:hypothetical protein